MEVAAKCEGRELELFLPGELDHHGAKGLLQRLDREIETALPLRLTLDFSAVTFMDSSGLAVAMRARQRMRELGGTARLVRVPAQPERVFRAAGIGKWMEIS